MMLDPFSINLIIVSIIVFAIHNIEETIGIEGWMAEKFPPRIAQRYRKKPFFIATFLLWSAYSTVALIAVCSGKTTALQLFTLAFAAIVANGLFHVLAVPVFHKISPGFWSAIVLILPLGGLFAWHTVNIGLMTLPQAVLAFLAGTVVQVPLAAAAIFIANLVVGPKKKDILK